MTDGKSCVSCGESTCLPGTSRALTVYEMSQLKESRHSTDRITSSEVSVFAIEQELTPEMVQNGVSVTAISIISTVVLLIFAPFILPKIAEQIDAMALEHKTKNGDPIVLRSSIFGASATLAFLPLVNLLIYGLHLSNTPLTSSSLEQWTSPAHGDLYLYVYEPQKEVDVAKVETSEGECSYSILEPGYSVEVEGLSKAIAGTANYGGTACGFWLKCSKCVMEGRSRVELQVRSNVQFLKYVIVSEPEFPSETESEAFNISDLSGFVVADENHVIEGTSEVSLRVTDSFYDDQTSVNQEKNSWFWVQYEAENFETEDAAQADFSSSDASWKLVFSFTRNPTSLVYLKYARQTMVC